MREDARSVAAEHLRFRLFLPRASVRFATQPHRNRGCLSRAASQLPSVERSTHRLLILRDIAVSGFCHGRAH